MRIFIKCSYNGTAYAGWQRQPEAISVQQVLEEAFSLILRENVEITGCGRTDAGVHAQDYYFHFDTIQEFPPEILTRFNKYLPKDIALHAAYSVPEDASARYAAVSRTYQYYLRFSKDALAPELSLWYPHRNGLNVDMMEAVAKLICEYEEFKPFCKEGSDAKHYRCQIHEARWTTTDRELIFTIRANRFLRGMVRLIVGACLQAGRGKLTLDEIRTAMSDQTPVPRAESAPAHGLHLVSINYPAGLLKSL